MSLVRQAIKLVSFRVLSLVLVARLVALGRHYHTQSQSTTPQKLMASEYVNSIHIIISMFTGRR